MKKQMYETPQCEALEMAFEQAVLQASLSNDFGDPGRPGGNLIEDNPLDFLGF